MSHERPRPGRRAARRTRRKIRDGSEMRTFGKTHRATEESVQLVIERHVRRDTSSNKDRETDRRTYRQTDRRWGYVDSWTDAFAGCGSCRVSLRREKQSTPNSQRDGTFPTTARQDATDLPAYMEVLSPPCLATAHIKDRLNPFFFPRRTNSPIKLDATRVAGPCRDEDRPCVIGPANAC